MRYEPQLRPSIHYNVSINIWTSQVKYAANSAVDVISLEPEDLRMERHDFTQESMGLLVYKC